jgi:hypothetical protein
MKKTLLTFAFALAALFATAQTKNYTDNLVVTVDGTATEPQETTITVEQAADGTCTLSLNNFMLGGMVKVGNIVVDKISTTENNNIKSFEVGRNISITAGEGNEEDWLGPMLGEVPVNIIGKMDDEHLYCTINIVMEELGTINVVFGDRKVFVEKTATYTDNLVVDVDGEKTDPQQTTIAVETNKDYTYTLSLNNFMLLGAIPVGNIVVENITPEFNGKIANFTTNRNILITAGDGEAEWIGPGLGEVPINLAGKLDAANLYCTISISMEDLGTINVVFGEEGKVTSIEHITTENGAKVIYDLTGRRVESIGATGIYIVNGKKTLVK